MPEYEHIKNNKIYQDYKNDENVGDFYDFVLATLMALENNDITNALQFVKFLKDETKYGLKRCKDWYDIMDDLVYIIEHGLTLEQFSRKRKLKNIIKRIENE
jgi:uncharacterized protein YehS (DUF1456 family)